MFSVGEKIAYGGTGVCIVEEVLTMRCADTREEKLFYVLRPLYQSGTIRTPVDNDKIPVRAVLTRKEAEQLVDALPGMHAEICHEKNLNALRNHYLQCMSSFRCEDLLALAKSIYAKKEYAERIRKKLGATDERFLRRAEELLSGELAVALSIAREEVSEYIRKKLCLQTAE